MNAMHTNMKNRIIMMAFALSAAVASAATITVDDFANHNTQANSKNLSLTKTENGLTLTFGVLGTSNSGWDAFGTGTSTFGQSGAWFDAQYVKFGNSGNQQLLDFRITNNTGSDVKLTNISFDIRKQPGNANPTGWQLLYLATGDSALIKGASVASGSEMVNLAGLGTDTIEGGINNYSESIGGNIQGTAWIANGDYANIRLKINTAAAGASSQMDNFSVTVTPVPEPRTYALIGGLLALGCAVMRRRISGKNGSV
jgi:hypothetical protein